MNRKRKIRYTLVAALIVVVAGAGVVAWYIYNTFYRPNIYLPSREMPFFIGSNSSADQVLDSLSIKGWIRSESTFRRAADRMNYNGANVVGGKYTLYDGMSNRKLIEKLRLGRGVEQVRVTFHDVRTPEKLASTVDRQIEADSSSISQLFTDTLLMDSLGFTPEEFPAMFLSDTYFFQWNTKAEDFAARMYDEYQNYWTPERKDKAEKIDLTPVEVIILASIVQAEQALHPDERPTIAGLYLNRLRRNIKLQSDPTVIYAIGDFSIQRVLTRHLSVEHPYNTYQNAGLPPGPILFPSKNSIEAVLNAEDHNYLYMCAKPDFSGYHNFARTLSQHNRNAAAFRRALNERQIYR